MLALEIFPTYVAVRLWMKASISGMLHKKPLTSLFLIYLTPFYSEDSSNCSVVEDCELAEILFREIPRFTSPEKGVKGAGDIHL
mmetsp:Transcript_16717/g.23832  ORF Transcript_16717/g.23832 Transcript_16717/m.23832 type:complete len:84 (-) Transcript_16717:275-526(-)